MTAHDDERGESGSQRPFVDRPVEDVAAARRAARNAAEAWGLPTPEPLRRGMNAIFRSGEVILRVGHVTADAAAGTALAHVLASEGIRVPTPAHPEAVYSGDLAVTAWERLVETSHAVDWEEVGAMVARLHELDRSLLPAAYPLADPRRFPWWDFESLLSEVSSHLDRPALEGLIAAVERGSGWTSMPVEDQVVCHGDVHPGNVLATPAGPVLLDWDLACRAPRGWDHGPLMTWERRWSGDALYEPFAAGYGWSGKGDPFTESVAEMRLVAATLMRVRAALVDPGARDEAELRLRYWRGDTDAPPWTAQ